MVRTHTLGESRIEITPQTSLTGELKPTLIAPLALQELGTLYRANETRILGEPVPKLEGDSFQGVALSPEAFQALLLLLQDPNRRLWREKATAAWILGQADLRTLQEKIAVEALCDVVSPKPPSTVASKPASHGLFAGLFAKWNPPRHEKTPSRLAAIHALGRRALPEAISSLACAALEAPLHTASLKALYQTLPYLHTEHFGKMDAYLVPNLCRLLLACTPAHTEAKLKTLGALAKIGDARAERTLECMKADELLERSANPRVLQSLNHALDMVRKRKAQTEAVLLQDAPQVATADLSRPTRLEEPAEIMPFAPGEQEGEAPLLREIS
jgi:hypothetical protein